MFVAVALWLLPLAASAHVPVPPGVLNPQSAEEAWNVVRLSTANTARLLAENRLSEIPEQIALCSPALRALPRWATGTPDAVRMAAVEAVQSGVAVGSLAQAGMAGDRELAESALGSLREHLGKLGAAYDPKTVSADIYSCPMHPADISPDKEAHCPKCGMGLLLRRIAYSFVYVPPGEPSVVLSARTGQPLAAGQEAVVTLRLSRRDGSPVDTPDLLVMHTQPVHVLIVDPTLNDYHHEHPTPTGSPGEYRFTFTPARPTSYRLFADLVPVETGVQEYASADLPGAEQPPPAAPRADAFEAEAAGLRFRLDPGAGVAALREGRACSLKVRVVHTDGQPMTALEPVMNAYAHLVGFYDDARTVVHLHPFGEEVTDANRRGGPELEFKFYPPRSGVIRLFCQVQVGGRQVFAPFTVHVDP